MLQYYLGIRIYFIGDLKMKLPKHLERLLIYSLIISTIPVILLGVFSYVTTSINNTNRVTERMLSLLYETKNTVDYNLSNIDQSLNQLTQSPIIRDTTNYQLIPSEFQMIRDTKEHLDFASLSTQEVASISFISNSYNWALYPDRTFKFNEEDIDIFNKLNESPVLINHNYSSDTQFTKVGIPHSLLFIKPIQIGFSAPENFILASVEYSELNQWVLDSEILGEIYIIDDNKNIISSNIKGDNYNHAIESIVKNNITIPNQENGYFTMNVDGNNNYVFYQKSDFTDWTFLSFVPQSIIKSEFNNIAWATVIISLGVAGLMIYLSYKGSLYIYSPINNLFESFFPNKTDSGDFDEFVSLSKYIESNQHKIALQGKELLKYYLSKLLVGELFQNEVDKIFKLSPPEFVLFDKYVVVSIKLNFTDRENNGTDANEHLIYAAHNIVGETITESSALPPVIINNIIVCIIGFKKFNQEKSKIVLLDIADKIKYNVQSYLGLTLNIGVSQTFYNLNIANQAFNESLDALKYQVIDEDNNTVIFIDEVDVNLNNNLMVYPEILSMQLKEAIKFNEDGKVNTILNELINSITKNEGTPSDYSIIFIRLLSEILELYKYSGDDDQLDLNSQVLLGELLSQHTKVEIEEWFKNRIIYPLMDYIQKNKKNEQKILSEEIIHLINKYGSETTLDLIADKLNYTPTYLSQVFRKEKDISFSQYLNVYKVNLSKQLLINTDLTVKEIAEELSFSNSQNFIRFFKKEVGTTPKRYRDTN